MMAFKKLALACNTSLTKKSFRAHDVVSTCSSNLTKTSFNANDKEQVINTNAIINIYRMRQRMTSHALVVLIVLMFFTQLRGMTYHSSMMPSVYEVLYGSLTPHIEAY